MEITGSKGIGLNFIQKSIQVSQISQIPECRTKIEAAGDEGDFTVVGEQQVAQEALNR